MNGRTAKKLRKAAYGDLSLKAPRTYRTDEKGTRTNEKGTPRAVYQLLKKNPSVRDMVSLVPDVGITMKPKRRVIAV